MNQPKACPYCHKPLSGRNICPRCSEKRKLVRKIRNATWQGKQAPTPQQGKTP